MKLDLRSIRYNNTPWYGGLQNSKDWSVNSTFFLCFTCSHRRHYQPGLEVKRTTKRCENLGFTPEVVIPMVVDMFISKFYLDPSIIDGVGYGFYTTKRLLKCKN